MKPACLSTFTPSMMSHETLEGILVQRHDLVKGIVESMRASILSAGKHFVLLIGPRGIGKTHVISLVYHRLKQMKDVEAKFFIAWLREEEWGVSAFRDLLMRILQSLADEQGDATLEAAIQGLYELSPDQAERRAAELLTEFVQGRTLVVLSENLDAIFDGLEREGQHSLRAFLQNHPFVAMAATSQSLFPGVSLNTSPFYGWFEIHHLEELSFEESVTLLSKIAAMCEDEELARFVESHEGRARIRAVHHIGGGNHRVYVMFSQFITVTSLEELVEAVMQTLEKLTPYYHSRMALLSPQKRKIVEYLIERRGAAPVKDIARHCFTTHQSISSQLKTLTEEGYVKSRQIGSESHYELREPLMRICIEVKKHQGRPIRLLVDFLRIWYSREELEKRMKEGFEQSAIDKQYLEAALSEQHQPAEDLAVAACRSDFLRLFESGDYRGALQAVDDALGINPSAPVFLRRAACLVLLERMQEALESLEKCCELNPDIAGAWWGQGIVLKSLGRHEDALTACEKALEIDPKAAGVWEVKGAALENLGRHDEAGVAFEQAIPAYEAALRLEPRRLSLWLGKGRLLTRLGRDEEALLSFEKAIDIDANDAEAWHAKGIALKNLNRDNEAMSAYDHVVRINPEHSRAWHNRAVVLKGMRKYGEALEAVENACSLNEGDSKQAFLRCVLIARSRTLGEGIRAFSVALKRFPNEQKLAEITSAEIIVAMLECNLNGVEVLQDISLLLDTIESHGGEDILVNGWVCVLQAFSPKLEVPISRLQKWVLSWHKALSTHTRLRKEIAVPLRIAKSVIGYRRKADERVLLGLASEEREIAKEILGLDENKTSAD